MLLLKKEMRIISIGNDPSLPVSLVETLLSFIFSSISRNEALVLETISFLSSSSSGKISLRFFSNKPLSMIKRKLSVK